MPRAARAKIEFSFQAPQESARNADELVMSNEALAANILANRTKAISLLADLRAMLAQSNAENAQLRAYLAR
jgi:hypothetical protein